jgi:hypothetical protein
LKKKRCNQRAKEEKKNLFSTLDDATLDVVDGKSPRDKEKRGMGNVIIFLENAFVPACVCVCHLLMLDNVFFSFALDFLLFPFCKEKSTKLKI